MFKRLTCLRDGGFVLRRLFLFLSLHLVGRDLMQHQYLTSRETEERTSDVNGILFFFMVLGDFTEKRPLCECAPSFFSVNFSNLQYMPADRGTKGSMYHLPEQNICATKIKTVM